MRRLIFGVCMFAAACSTQSSGSPTAPFALDSRTVPSIATGGTPGASSTLAGGNVEVTFTKWITTFPGMVGVTGGDVPGTFVGEVLRRTPFDNGVIVELEARYQVVDPTGLRSFTALIEGNQNNSTASAVLNGVITEGWMAGAQVHVTFDVITPCDFGTRNVCFQGTIRVMQGSAH
jgi:hypothetical protein